MNFVVRIFIPQLERSFFSFHLGKFDGEKQNLLEEIKNLQRAKNALEQGKRANDQELREIRDRSRASADELTTTQLKVRTLEQQVSLNHSQLLSI